MDVSVLTMNQLFGQTIRFLIPTFQRPYVWNKDEQWEPLWDDVRNTAENYIEHDGPDEELRSHFLGAVWWVPMSGPRNGKNKVHPDGCCKWLSVSSPYLGH